MPTIKQYHNCWSSAIIINKILILIILKIKKQISVMYVLKVKWIVFVLLFFSYIQELFKNIVDISDNNDKATMVLYLL